MAPYGYGILALIQLFVHETNVITKLQDFLGKVEMRWDPLATPNAWNFLNPFHAGNNKWHWSLRAVSK
jgi:hypothetical protein